MGAKGAGWLRRGHGRRTLRMVGGGQGTVVKETVRRVAELMQAAIAQEAKLAEAVADTARKARLLKWVLQPWAQLVRSGGPQRRTALAEVRSERHHVVAVIDKTRQDGVISAVRAASAEFRLRHATIVLTADVDKRIPGGGARAAALWCIARAVRVDRWRASKPGIPPHRRAERASKQNSRARPDSGARLRSPHAPTPRSPRAASRRPLAHGSARRRLRERARVHCSSAARGRGAGGHRL